MHILVTDRLACPRCGPTFGLVMFAELLEERRVRNGSLGCPNCRERYPIEGGFGDLRPSPRPVEAVEPIDFLDDPTSALRLAAMLGVREGPGLILLSGSAVSHAGRIAGMIEGIEVVALHPGLRTVTPPDAVSAMTTGDRLPFFSGSLRGVILEGADGAAALQEGTRVLAPGAHLVLRAPPEDARAILDEVGLELILEADSVLVGQRK